MTPDWLNDAVRAFGRQMGLQTLALNDRGAAGLRFENGLALHFEYAQESLVVSARVNLPPREDLLKRLLVAVHPSARRGAELRAAYLSKSGEALYAVRLPERRVDVSALEVAFRAVWSAADAVRRAAQ